MSGKVLAVGMTFSDMEVPIKGVGHLYVVIVWGLGVGRSGKRWGRGAGVREGGVEVG